MIQYVSLTEFIHQLNDGKIFYYLKSILMTFVPTSTIQRFTNCYTRKFYLSYCFTVRSVHLMLRKAHRCEFHDALSRNRVSLQKRIVFVCSSCHSLLHTNVDFVKILFLFITIYIKKLFKKFFQQKTKLY